MGALVIKNMPEELHRRLKLEAKRHRRSLTQQAVLLIENALDCGSNRDPGIDPAKLPAPTKLVHPLKGEVSLTAPMLRKAIRKGRA